MTVGQLLDAITSEELTEWMAFDSIEPIGCHRLDYAAAVVASTIANVHRPRHKPPMAVSKFTPFIKQATEMLAPMDAFHVLHAMAVKPKAG